MRQRRREFCQRHRCSFSTKWKNCSTSAEESIHLAKTAGMPLGGYGKEFRLLPRT